MRDTDSPGHRIKRAVVLFQGTLGKLGVHFGADLREQASLVTVIEFRQIPPRIEIGRQQEGRNPKFPKYAVLGGLVPAAFFYLVFRENLPQAGRLTVVRV